MTRMVLGDNFKVDVRASGYEVFEAALALAFNGRSASYYAETQSWGLLYFWFVSDQEGLRTEHRHSRDRCDDGYQYHHRLDDGTVLYSYDSSEDYWSEQYQIRSMPKLSVGPLLETTWEWLQRASYPEPLDHDGSNNRGFRIRNADSIWEGHFGDHRGVVCSVMPDWMWLGK